MNVYSGFLSYHSDVPTAVTVGKFDGLHRGHRLLIDAVAGAAKEGLRPVVITIDEDPPADSILSPAKRCDMLSELGIEDMVSCRLDPAFRAMTAEDFLEVLASQYQAKRIVCGEDFRFGAGGRGDCALLEKKDTKLGFKACIFPRLRDTQLNVEISSTQVRRFLEEGRMEDVGRLLGYLWFLDGEIVGGRHQGRTWRVPTINIIPPERKLLPPRGVYATDTAIGNVWYKSVTNIGVSPTVTDAGILTAETHLLDCSEDLYGRTARVCFKHFLRPEQHFSSIEELSEQLQKDIAIARDM